MSHILNIISSKPSFGNIRESLCQSDYLNKKKGLITYNNNNNNNTGNAFCNKIKQSNNYDNINLYNNTRRYMSSVKNRTLYNKNNLVAGQYSKLNLNNICVSIPSEPKYSNSDYMSPDGRCAYCVDTNLASNNTKINVNCLGQYVDPLGNVVPFYQDNTIDPEGQLFGNSQCGELSFTTYMVFSMPVPTI